MANLLDLLITNMPDYVSNFEVTDQLDNLDHSMIVGVLKAYYAKQLSYRRTVRHFTDERLQTLNSKLCELDWQGLLLCTTTADDCAETFVKLLTENLDAVIPPVSVVIRPRDKPGMTSYVRKFFKKSHKLCRLAKQTKLHSDKVKHALARRKAKKAWFVAQQKKQRETLCQSHGTRKSVKIFLENFETKFWQ
jgi:hypothetical protein